MKLAELNIKIASAFLNTLMHTLYLPEYKCLYCNKNYQKKFDEGLRKGFVNT